MAMKNAALKISTQQLRQFASLDKLSDEDAQELLRTSITVQLSAGTPIFHANDNDKRVFYLLEGKIEVITDTHNRHIIRSGSKEAKEALGNHIPWQLSATALTDSVLLSFDSDMLEIYLSWTTPDGYQVDEMNLSDSGKWLDRLLQSRGLLRFSEEHIQNLLSRMNEVHYKAGDVVIQQDNVDDFYYVIKSGRVSVSRKPFPTAKDIKLAELSEGDSFGEEALLANTPRGATIIMQEDGDLMRLSKQDFSELLAQPLLNSVAWEESRKLVKTGAVFLDIRLPDEFNQQHLPNSINIPLPLLRLKLDKLNTKRKYIVCCNDGSRSAAAAFLLNRQGFDAYILDGGLNAAKEFLDESGSGITQSETIPQPQPTDASANENSASHYADQWRETSDNTADELFKDNADIDPAGKTRPVASTILSATINPALNYQAKDFAGTKKATAQTSTSTSTSTSKKLPHKKRRSRLFGSLLILTLLASSGIFTLQQLGINDPQALFRDKVMPLLNLDFLGLIEHTPLSIDEPFDEPPANTTAEEASRASEGDVSELTPWSDATEDPLMEIVGEPDLELPDSTQ